MNENEDKKHPLEYEFTISFTQDGITARMTGESVDFIRHADSVIRHRHTRLTTALADMMRDYIRDVHGKKEK